MDPLDLASLLALQSVPAVTEQIATDYFPMLYKRTKNGNIAWYDITVDYYLDENIAVVNYTKASGIGYRSQHDFGEYQVGVNVGKKNETTPFQQAFLVAQSVFRKLLDHGYKEGIPAADVLHNTDADGDGKPMLAQSFNPDKATFPYLAQPKLNGVRCALTVGTAKGGGRFATLKSRGGKFYNVPIHITVAAVEHLPVGQYDGELYHHGWKLQRITSAVKKWNDKDTPQIQFVCYDFVNTALPFDLRYGIIRNSFERLPEDCPLKLCPTQEVRYLEMAYDFASRVEKEGYEGAMLRDPKSFYQPGFRSKGLLKLKKMIDAEFKIIGVNSAKGRNSGCAVFVCETPEGKTFNANPEGTLEYRRELYDDRKNLIGKMLTVRFQEYSEDMIPIFPVGVVVRDYE